jgi:tetratricopeptide (TPR) repeat protein
MRLVAQGDPRGAEEAFRRSLLLAEAGAAQYGLGLALEAEGRADEAAAAYRTALRQEPGGPWAVDAGARAQRLERAAPARP